LPSAIACLGEEIMRVAFLSLATFCAAFLPIQICLGQEAIADATTIEFFEKKIRPVLLEHCSKCHTGQKVKGGLRLDSRSALLKGGDNGPALVPGDPAKSRVLVAVGYKDVDLQMPPKAKLPDAVIADLTAWVKMGAPWPAEKSTATATANSFDLQKRKKEHWAWQPVHSSKVPEVRNTQWPRSAIDNFILAKLDAKNLSPAGPADKRTLLRRLSFDLIGLPPTPAEVEAFVNDRSPDALAKLVDRLLESPHFGERWARHWLDLVRYAETRGHEFDFITPNAYQYRDYVIRAFNADLPYNDFVVEQLAGDLLPKPRLHPAKQFNESILGTGFWFLGEQVHSPVDVRQDEADRYDNMLDVFGKTFLGLTVACARCHDHKFDAISTKDYYALFSVLASSGYRQARFDTMEQDRRIAVEIAELRQKNRAPLQAALVASWQATLERLADYLLAARAVLISNGRERAALIQEIARTKNLNANLLEQWTMCLAAAAKDSRDPLYPFAKPASEARLTESLKPILDEWRKRDADADAALRDATVIVDYSKTNSETWLQDGITFGLAPLRPGDVRFGTEANRPFVQVFDYAAAQKDPIWERSKPAIGADNDPGALNKVVRAGRTLRTPSFTVKADKVFYLVKGNAQAYAAIDSHALISGPLHASLVLPIKAGEQFQWVAHDLRPYKGQRACIEFTPGDSTDFAVALVVQADRAPGSPARPNAVVRRLLDGESASSFELLSQGYQRLFLDVSKRFAADQIIDRPDAAEYARLADWLVQHAGCLTTGEKVPDGPAAAFIAEQARLTGQIQESSRLAMAMMDGTGVDEHVFIRGSPKALGEKVPRRFLEALAGPAALAVDRGSGRLELARQVTDPQRNPLVARVLVNRVWHHLFGRGIVPSVDNFGVMGEPPTHPELLDYLADRFVRDGWSVKRLIRMLVLSSTYQMSAQAGGAGGAADPQNLLWHRMPIRRLEGEAIRDAMLLISGRLDRAQLGPPVPVYLTEFQQGRGRPAPGPLDGAGRRSIYLSVRRNFLPSFMLAFDTPIPFSTVGRRSVSNVPAQSLILLNDPLVQELARRWAQRLLASPGTAPERITAMYQSAFGRPPSANETRACLEFLDHQAALHQGKSGDQAAWADLAHVLFNAKEFVFLN
jgi:hypothetical protein